MAHQPIVLHPEQETTQTPAWQRQEGEPLLWYNRFKLFRNLGYKRTLLAALLKERETVKVLKGTDPTRKSGVLVSQVPGSWKRASIAWHWVERAASYDEHRIDQMVEGALDDLMEGPATSFHRVMMLKALLETLRTNLNTNAASMSLEQYCMMVQRMQSVIKQISDEMHTYDENVTRCILRRMSLEVYQEAGPAQHTQEEKRRSRAGAI